VAKGLKDVFMMLRLRLVNDDWDGERDTAMWPFPRNNKDQSKIHTTRFFKTTQNIEGVTPLDRMIAYGASWYLVSYPLQALSMQ
jgi:hypothetical protein